VTLYEGSSRLGGLLRSGLPQNRLPTNVLDWEIQGIVDVGVQTVTNQELGKDITIDTLLKQGFQSVFVATGGWDMQLTEKEADKNVQPLPGVQLLIEFILALRSGDKKKASLGNSVVILEGGSAGLDAARACLKSGVKSVHLVFRSSPMNAPFSEDDLTGSERKKITFHFQSGLTRMSGKGSKLTHVEISDLFAPAETMRLPANTLLTGAGRFPELVYIPSGKSTEGAPIKGAVSWETLIPSPSPFAEQDVGMFRPGEVVGDYKAVVEAIGAGRRAARTVHRYLYEQPVEAPENMIRKYTEVLNVNELEPVSTAPRQKMPELSKEAQINDPDAEIALGFSEEQAVTESKRCLQCGLICYRRVKGGPSG
jgi:NADPH-dependent glutamate synthase beta subunit-like oxidoreductase